MHRDIRHHMTWAVIAALAVATPSMGATAAQKCVQSKNKEAAASFIEYLLAGDPAIMADFFKTSGYSKYTVRTSVDEALANDPDASSDPFMKTISEKVVAYGKAEPGYPWDIALAPQGSIDPGSARNHLAVEVVSVTRVGNRVRIGLAAPQPLTAELTEPA